MFRFLPFLFLSISCFAQIDLETIKKVANSELGQKAKGFMLQKLDDMRSDYDEASFNYAVALSDNAGLFESEERYKKHQRILLDAFAASQGKEVDHASKALSLNSVGEMMYASGKYSSAETSFKQAQKLMEDAQDSIGIFYAQIISNLGLLYHTTGRFTLAEKWALKAREIRKRRSGEQSAVYASSLNNLAVLYKDLGHYTQAEEWIQTALKLNQVNLGKQSVPYALSLNNQAMIFYATGRSEEAQKLLSEALDIAGKTLKEKSANYVRLLINQALMYQDQGQYPEAEAIYLKAIKIKENRLSTHHPDYAHLLNNLAALYVLMGKTKEVESNLKKAAEIYKKKLGDKHPAYAATISNLGNFYRVSNRLVEAEPLLRQARDIRRDVLGERHPDYVASLESLGLLYWKTGNPAEASRLLRTASDKTLDYIHRYFASLSEVEKSKLWRKARPVFQHFYAFTVSKHLQYPILLTDMYNYQLATKAILLNATSHVREQIMKGNNAALKKKYARWLDQKEALAHAYSLSKEELKEEKTNLDSLENISNKLEKELAASSALFNRGYTKKMIKTADIAGALSISEAAVEIIQVNKFNNRLTDSVCYAALLLKKGNPEPTLILFKDGNALNQKYYKYYRNSIQLILKDEYSYAKFWQPIHEAISAKTVYLSLDGVYNQMNISTFLKPDGHYVADDKEVLLVTNTREIIRLKKGSIQKTSRTAVLIGDPAYGTKGTVPELPGTQKELGNAKKALLTGKYSVQYLVRSAATENRVREKAEAGIIHFATHGFFLPEADYDEDEMVFGIASAKVRQNPLLRAGLLLAGAEKAMEGKSEDGILTAFEVTGLSLQQTELVLLSACETGVGDVKNGEGVYGLQRAFQVAGANTIIMSLWKVNDAAAVLFMGSFYKHYLGSGNKYKAFRQAQSELKSKYKDPYYWGVFVMVE